MCSRGSDMLLWRSHSLWSSVASFSLLLVPLSLKLARGGRTLTPLTVTEPSMALRSCMEKGKTIEKEGAKISSKEQSELKDSKQTKYLSQSVQVVAANTFTDYHYAVLCSLFSWVSSIEPANPDTFLTLLYNDHVRKFTICCTGTHAIFY